MTNTARKLTMKPANEKFMTTYLGDNGTSDNGKYVMYAATIEEADAQARAMGGGHMCVTSEWDGRLYQPI